MTLRDDLIATLQAEVDNNAPDAVFCKGWISQLTLGGDDEIQANYDLNPDPNSLQRAKLTASQLGASSLDASIPDPTIEQLPEEDQQAIADDSLNN